MIKRLNLKKTALLVISLTTLLCASFFGGCTDAEMASHNLFKAADMFEINRWVVFFNGITDSYLLSIEGLCSIKADNDDKQLEVTCKISPTEYKKHYLGLSDNVSYFVEQLGAAKANTFHYRVIFKPKDIVPDVDFVN